MKLLRPFTGTGAVLFPVGVPPNGTCEFATRTCLKCCYAEDPNDMNFDEELRIPESEKWKIYECFVQMPVDLICAKILKDLDGLQTPILHWFGSGDCQTKDIDKISSIIKSIGEQIVQMGFTRNIELWQRHKEIFALTIDSKDDTLDKYGMYAVPDYEAQTSIMYVPSYQVKGGYCGPVICRDRDREQKDLDHYINCQTCLRLTTGCFDRRTNE